MNLIVIAMTFLSALLLTLARGAGVAFVWVYLPALLFFSYVSGFAFYGLPDPVPPTAAVYGVLIGSALRAQRARLRLTAVDAIFLLLPVAYVISAVRSEYFYTGVSIFGTMMLNLIAPYFIARVGLASREVQRQAAWVLAGCLLVIAAFAIVELRLWPNTYHELMANLGLRPPVHDWAYSRFGLFRATTAFEHPIDLGIGGGLSFAMIATLAVRSGLSLRGHWIQAGLLAALTAWAAALSFTSFLGFAAAAALYLGLSIWRRAQRHLVLAVAVLIAGGLLYTAAVGTAPLPERPDAASPLLDSLWVRQFIIKEGWELAVSAGPFGWGRLVEVGILESVDNAYLLIAIQRGWIAIALWLCVPLLLARQLAKALPRLPARALQRAALLGFCGVIGTMVAMYTVYLGGVYQSLLVIQIALTVSLSQLRRTVAVRVPAPSVRSARPRAVPA